MKKRLKWSVLFSVFIFQMAHANFIESQAAFENPNAKQIQPADVKNGLTCFFDGDLDDEAVETDSICQTMPLSYSDTDHFFHLKMNHYKEGSIQDKAVFFRDNVDSYAFRMVSLNDQKRLMSEVSNDPSEDLTTRSKITHRSIVDYQICMPRDQIESAMIGKDKNGDYAKSFAAGQDVDAASLQKDTKNICFNLSVDKALAPLDCQNSPAALAISDPTKESVQAKKISVDGQNHWLLRHTRPLPLGGTTTEYTACVPLKEWASVVRGEKWHVAKAPLSTSVNKADGKNKGNAQ